MDTSDVLNAEGQCALCSQRVRLRVFLIYGSGADSYELGHRFDSPAPINEVIEGSATCPQCRRELAVDVEIVDSVITGIRTRPAPPRSSDIDETFPF